MILRRQGADPGRELPPRLKELRPSGGLHPEAAQRRIGPTPGILSRRWLHSSALCQVVNLASISRMRACSWANSSA